MTSSVFWDMTLCSWLKLNQHIGGTCGLDPHSQRQRPAEKLHENKYQADPEDRGDMFFQNICWHSVDYIMLYPRG